MDAIGVTNTKLSDQRIVVYGAGSAGLGIARQIRDAMVHLDKCSKEDASKNFWLIDKNGLISDSLKSRNMVREGLEDFVQSTYNFKDTKDKEKINLLDVVKTVKPTVLIGCSTHAGAFTEDVVKAMKKNCERPIIFPLSNPSRLVEVDPKDANDWSEGMALIATGSPFPAVKGPKGKDYE